MTVTVPPVFNYQTWITRYPEFSAVSSDLAQEYYNEALLYFSNPCLQALPTAPTLLNMLTAHIAQLYAPRDAGGNATEQGATAPQTVGRVNSASQGSVSVGLDMGDANAGSPSQAWYMQTKYGTSYWYATVKYRSATYAPSARGRVFGPGAIFPSRFPNGSLQE